MPDPRPRHPLDIDLVDLVEGTIDPVDAAAIEEHLTACLSCRVRMQRIAGSPSIELVDIDADAPAFASVDIETADPASAQPGELWLTTTDDAAMVLVTKVRPEGRGLVVVPVVLDVEVADDSTLVLNEDVSPLPLPIAIYDRMAISLAVAALSARITPGRSDIDLLAVGDTSPGVRRGDPLDGPTDPRHEVRQAINDRIVAANPVAGDVGPSASADHDPVGLTDDDPAVDEQFELIRRAFGERKDTEVRPLDIPEGFPVGWRGVAQVDCFNQRLLLLVIDGGLPSDRSPVRALCESLRGSAIAVRSRADADVVDLYTQPVLAGARSVQTGDVLTTPVRGPVMTTIRAYLDERVSIPPVAAPTSPSRAQVDLTTVLDRQVRIAIEAQVAAGGRARTSAKQEGFTSLESLAPALVDLLAGAVSGTVTPGSITDLVGGAEP